MNISMTADGSGRRNRASTGTVQSWIDLEEKENAPGCAGRKMSDTKDAALIRLFSDGTAITFMMGSMLPLHSEGG